MYWDTIKIKTYIKHKTTIKMKERSETNIIINALFSYYLLLLLVITVSVVLILAKIAQSDKEINEVKQNTSIIQQRYDDAIYENELLWQYIENIDTFKSLDDAVEYRDNLIEQLQFIGE